MAVPKKRKTKSKTRQRRSHHALSAKKLGVCKNCGAASLPHMACTSCGFYRGKDLSDTATTNVSKEKTKAEKKS